MHGLQVEGGTNQQYGNVMSSPDGETSIGVGKRRLPPDDLADLGSLAG